MLVGLDKLPRGILLWRSILQAIGGVGIIAMAIIVLPVLEVGGMQLFKTESSDRSDKIMAWSKAIVRSMAGVYLVLLFACTAIYAIFGMTLFDAVCYAMATVSTGGFAIHDASFAYFNSPSLEVIAVIFMILGSLPFLIYVRAIQGHPIELFEDKQVRGFFCFMAFVWLMVTFNQAMTRDVPVFDALRLAAFNTTSIITTTGFCSGDYNLWGTFTAAAILILTLVGGCSGSTAGSIKIYRFQVMNLIVRRHLLSLMSPNRICPLRYNARSLPEDVPFSIVTFFVIYWTTIGIFTLLLAALGLDFVTSISSSAQAVGNVGPGLGDTVGPTGNFSTLPAEAKWLLAIAMLLGRLELFTALVLLRPEFWAK